MVTQDQVNQLYRKLFLNFNKNDLTVVKGDDIHKWERNDLEWEKYTHLNPKANDLHLEINMLRKLKIGRSIKEGV